MKKTKLVALVGKFSPSFGYKEISAEYEKVQGRSLSFATIRHLLTSQDASKKSHTKVGQKEQALFCQLVAAAGQRLSAGEWAASYGFVSKKVVEEIDAFAKGGESSEIVHRFESDFGMIIPEQLAPVVPAVSVASALPTAGFGIVSNVVPTVAGSLPPTSSNLLTAALKDNDYLRNENQELWDVLSASDAKVTDLQKQIADLASADTKKDFMRVAVRKIEQIGSAIKLIISNNDELFEEALDSLNQGGNVSTELVLSVDSVACKPRHVL